MVKLYDPIDGSDQKTTAAESEPPTLVDFPQVTEPELLVDFPKMSLPEESYGLSKSDQKGMDEKKFNLLKKAISNPVKAAARCTQTAVKKVTILRESLLVGGPEQACEANEESSEPSATLTSESEPEWETPTDLQLGYNIDTHNKEISDNSEIRRSSRRQRREISRTTSTDSSTHHQRKSGQRMSRKARNPGQPIRRQRSSSSLVPARKADGPGYQRTRSNSFSGGDSKPSSLIPNDDMSSKFDPILRKEERMEVNGKLLPMEDRSSISVRGQRSKRKSQLTETSKRTSSSKDRSKRTARRSTTFDLETSKNNRLVPLGSSSSNADQIKPRSKRPSNRPSRSPKRSTTGPAKLSRVDQGDLDFATATQGKAKKTEKDTITKEEESLENPTQPRTSLSKLCDGIAYFATSTGTTSTNTNNNNNHWDCTGCGEKNMQHHGFCGMCGSARPEPPAYWECILCGMNDNQCRFRFCGGCGSSRSQVEEKIKSNDAKTAPAAA